MGLYPYFISKIRIKSDSENLEILFSGQEFAAIRELIVKPVNVRDQPGRHILLSIKKF